ncbi:MAG: SMI1/KNR4 family protein [Chitinophagaceae bacterium]|nr:SMI1/KNR4 family protein [Chitinophagaceae bacterium]
MNRNILFKKIDKFKVDREYCVHEAFSTIYNFENKWAIQLPDDYKSFVKEIEVAVEICRIYSEMPGDYHSYIDFPINYFFELDDERGVAYLANIYGINDSITYKQDDNLIRQGFLIIGDNGCGDLILLNIVKGKVFYFDHEINPEPIEAKELLLICNSFSEFMDGLIKKREVINKLLALLYCSYGVGI